MLNNGQPCGDLIGDVHDMKMHEISCQRQSYRILEAIEPGVWAVLPRESAQLAVDRREIELDITGLPTRGHELLHPGDRDRVEQRL